MANDDQAGSIDVVAIEAEHRERHFFDSERREWSVREADLPEYDRRSGRCLIFQTDTAARRVRAFPPNWFSLTDVELYSLSVAPTRPADPPALERVCFFNPIDGPIVVELTPDALAPRMYHDGREYQRHVLTLVAPSDELVDVTFYSVMPPSSDERTAISRALFGDRADARRVDPAVE